MMSNFLKIIKLIKLIIFIEIEIIINISTKNSSCKINLEE